MKEENTGSNETSGPQVHLIGMGKDEMNLAEFPLTTLADRVPQGCKTLVFEDRIFDSGQRQLVTRRLTISASDKFGLPTALDDEVILGLVQLSKADDFANRQVQFSRYELVHLLGWREEGKSYARLEESLKRWLGVTLYYEKAWRDNSNKRWVDAHFHLLDNLILFHRSKRGERSAPGEGDKSLSSFTWNEIVFRSFQAGNLKSIDLEFYKSLKSAVAKRIYRFLDKHFYKAHEWRYRPCSICTGAHWPEPSVRCRPIETSLKSGDQGIGKDRLLETAACRRAVCPRSAWGVGSFVRPCGKTASEKSGIASADWPGISID